MTLDESDLLAARILVVDDQPANVVLLAQMLGDAGYGAVSTTTNPRDVAKMHRHDPFDLILLDLQMPGMDGFEVMAELEQIEPLGYLPVLVVTAQPSAKLRALQAGAKDFVTKPFDVVEIKTRIRNMLEVRLLYKHIEGENRLLEQAVAMRTTELRDSEARFRALVELASDWYWEQDEHGAFTKVAGPALEMLGLGESAATTIIGGAPMEAFAGTAPAGAQAGGDDATVAGTAPRWNADERAQLEEKLATRKPFLDFVYRRVNADGSEQFLQTSGEPKFDETGRFRGYRGIGMDVTGRMHAGASPQQARLERFRAAVDALGDAILLRDAASLRYLDANAAAGALTGYAADELATLPSDALAAAGADAMPDQAPRCTEEVWRRKDGGSVAVRVERRLLQRGGDRLVVEQVRARNGNA